MALLCYAYFCECLYHINILSFLIKKRKEKYYVSALCYVVLHVGMSCNTSIDVQLQSVYLHVYACAI